MDTSSCKLAASLSFENKSGSLVDHRRCLTTEVATVGGAGAYMTMMNNTTKGLQNGSGDILNREEFKTLD